MAVKGNLTGKKKKEKESNNLKCIVLLSGIFADPDPE